MYNDLLIPTPWGGIPAWILTVTCAAVMIPAIFLVTKSAGKRMTPSASVWLVVIIVLPFVGAVVFLVQHWIGKALRGPGKQEKPRSARGRSRKNARAGRGS